MPETARLFIETRGNNYFSAPLFMTIFDSDLRIIPAALEARARGVLFDVGHGAGSFAFGRGEAALADGGFGLAGLRERAEDLGGRLQWETAPGHGFALTMELPA